MKSPKKVRIGLLEILSSNHGFSGLCDMCDPGRYDVTVFTTLEMLPQLKTELNGDLSQYELLVKDTDESLKSYLKRVEDVCNEQIDLLIINTIDTLDFIFFDPCCKKLFWMYNVNEWFHALSEVSRYSVLRILSMPSPRELRRIIRNIIMALFKAISLPKYDGIIVEYAPIRKYILANFKYNKPIYVLPNWSSKPVHPSSRSVGVRFTVPGIIDKSRRDYELILRVFEKLSDKYPGLVELCLLGPPSGEYGSKILAQCLEFKKKGIKITDFADFVPPGVFEEMLKNTDVVLSPLKLDFTGGYSHEVYSLSKGTGVLGDCIRYGKPLILPHGFIISDELTGSVITYTDEDELLMLLSNLVKDGPILEKLRHTALENSRNFSIENLRHTFDMMVNEQISDKS